MSKNILQINFELARAKGTLEVLSGPLIDSMFVLPTKGVDSAGDLILCGTHYEKEDVFCLVASEPKSPVKMGEGFRMVPVSGREVVQSAPDGFGVLFAYEVGGDFLNPDGVRFLKQFFETRKRFD